MEALKGLLLRFGMASLLVTGVLLKLGFREPVMSPALLTTAVWVLVAALWVMYGLSYRWSGLTGRAWFGERWRAVVLLALATISLTTSWMLAGVFFGLLLVLLFARVYIALSQFVRRYSILFISSFVVMILVGALLLMLPAATPPGDPIGALDALFTSTSAVCVTGLIVRDTATQFTLFGQTIILILVQLGGLGIVIFGALLATMLGGSMSLKHEANIEEVVSSVEGGIGQVDRLVRFVVVATLLTELLGAIFLFFGYGGSSSIAGETLGGRLYSSVFVSISAFCNAGFSPFSDSLESFRLHWTTHAVVVPLIVIGGLGFPALFNLWQVFTARMSIRLGWVSRRRLNRRRLIRLTLHTKIVLITTAILYVLGTFGLILGQLTPNLHQWAGLNVTANAAEPEPLDAAELGRTVLDASFMSVSARTAGFNTTDVSERSRTSQFVLMLLMWVGGSPGSTAGGVKTVAVAVLFLSIWATVRGRERTEVFGRSLPDELIRRAGTLVMLGFLTVAATVFALTITETPDFASQLFEAVSACGTVGLSSGLTDGLTRAGRVIIIMAMFLGRIGPLAMLGVLVVQRRVGSAYAYPPEGVIMG